MDDRQHPGRVEDYTAAFLVTVGVILFMAFFTIAALFGLAWVLLSALLVERCIRALPRLRSRA